VTRPSLSGAARLRHAHELRRAYDAGATIRQICADQGRSYGSVHDLLALAGTVFRPRGTERKAKPTEGTQP
jgi:Helix-turn-helix domain